LSAIGGSGLTGSVLGWLYIMCFGKLVFFMYYSMLAFWISKGFFCVCVFLISMWFCNLSCTLVAILKIFFRTL
jgi:hypothetical protein